MDDYHTIHGTEVHNLIGELVRHWPKPLHLVLISRINPPIPLASLRAKGMLSEIRTQDLRFTTGETVAYLSQAQVAPLSQPALHLLDERFEGWPAGLHLAALSLRPPGSQESILSALSGKDPNISGYLVDEVLTHQVSAIHSFLLKTSILDRFCASLCEAIIVEMDPAWNVRLCLDWIERSELFLTPLDSRQEWYRYHHLFKEIFTPGDTIVAMCRSGGRSDFAINMLAKAGFTNIYNIIDGFEGDTVNDLESVYHGKLMKNGWKNSAPWTYDLDPAKVWIPTGEELEKLRSTLDI